MVPRVCVGCASLATVLASGGAGPGGLVVLSVGSPLRRAPLPVPRQRTSIAADCLVAVAATPLLSLEIPPLLCPGRRRCRHRRSRPGDALDASCRARAQFGPGSSSRRLFHFGAQSLERPFLPVAAAEGTAGRHPLYAGLRRTGVEPHAFPSHRLRCFRFGLYGAGVAQLRGHRNLGIRSRS